MPRLHVAAAQIDVVVGDLEGNVDRILATYEQAEAAGCDVVVFPELTITGYPPEDLLLRPVFSSYKPAKRWRRSRRAPAAARR